MTKTARTNYIDRVRKGIEIYKAMEAMEDKEKINFKYGNRTNEYEIYCLVYKSGNKTYSVREANIYFGSSMNIDIEKSTKVYLYLYTYDLFSTKTTAKLDFEHIILTENTLPHEL